MTVDHVPVQCVRPEVLADALDPVGVHGAPGVERSLRVGADDLIRGFDARVADITEPFLPA